MQAASLQSNALDEDERVIYYSKVSSTSHLRDIGSGITRRCRNLSCQSPSLRIGLDTSLEKLSRYPERCRDNQSNPVFDAEVSIQVNDPGNNLVQVQLLSSDQSGSYTEPLSLSGNSPTGQYMVYATASKPGYSNGRSQAQFSVSIQSTTSTSTLTTPPTTTSTPSSSTTSFYRTTSSTPNTTTSLSSSLSTETNAQPKCLIATATYGSEIAPEVTLLRDFRDYAVLRTSAGESFMRVFNAFYYSFSPEVSTFIASQNLVRTGMKIILSPLIDILYVSSLVFAATSFNSEVAITITGVLASFEIGLIHLGPILTVLSRFLKSNSSPPYAIRVAFYRWASLHWWDCF